MRIHSIESATLCPRGQRLINGRGALLAPGRMVCHSWLIETPRDGLVLVDTGIGLDDIADLSGRLGRMFALVTNPLRARENTAVGQLERRGFTPRDVRHIVVTHLDLDHAGGIPDFPHAEVHVHRAELDAALAPRTLRERERYRKQHWAHGPKWAPHDVEGEAWFGFRGVRALGVGADEVLLVPLHGHTRGHCGVAARADDGWRLHAGDAYFFHGEVRGGPPCPPGLALFQHLVAMDDPLRLDNQRRLRELHRAHGAEVRVHSAHCPVEFDELRAQDAS